MNPLPLNYNQLAAQYVQNRQTQPQVVKNLLATAGITADSRILELGCGTGNYIAALQAAAGCAGWGLDLSPGMLLQAKSRAPLLNLQVGRAEAPGFRDNSFDLLFSVDVIHHVRNLPAYFRAAYRLLKTGGRICTVTDSAWIIQHRQPLAIYFPETVPLELERYPAISRLKEIMAQAGFREVVEQTVEAQYELVDSQAYRAKAFSALHLISEEAFQRGLERLEKDLQLGPVPGVLRYLLLWGVK
jgi:ubiquinone/menaquinone biosynthesis C-methylase UbiE